MLMNSYLHVPTLVDMQAHYRIAGSGKKPWEKSTLKDLSAAINCPSYKDLHKNTNRQCLNRTWEEPLSQENIAYAARNTCTSYSMYSRTGVSVL